MNCEAAQQEILMADDPGAAAARPEIADHARNCPQCAALVRQLTQLELAARGLPVRGAMAAQPLPLVMERILDGVKTDNAAANSPNKTGCLRRTLRGWAAAAAVIIVGLVALSLLTSARPARAEAVYGDLVAWNLRISGSHDPAVRARLYQEHLADVNKEIDSLSPSDKVLAEELRRNAEWLTRANDQVAETTHFVDIAEQLKAREKAFDSATAAKIDALYHDVVRQGIEPAIQQIDPQTLSPDQQKALQELQKRAQPHLVPASLPAAAAPVQGYVPGYGTGRQIGGSSAGTSPQSLPPLSPMHDFMPGNPYSWTPPSSNGVVVITGTSSGSSGNTSNATTGSHNSKGTTGSANEPPGASTAGAGTAANGATTGTKGDGSCANLPPITDGTASAGGTGSHAAPPGDLPDPHEFDSGSAGAGSHPRDQNPDWSWGMWNSGTADGNLPGWMKCGGGNADGMGQEGRNVADKLPASDGSLGDTDVVRGPDGSTMPNPNHRPHMQPGLLDFGGTGAGAAGTAGVPATTLPEPSAGLLLALGLSTLLPRRRRR